MSDSHYEAIAEHLDYFNTLRVDAIELVDTNKKVFSKIGGLPDLPDNIEWPVWKLQNRPLAFICQLDMAELPTECCRGDLPETGLLFFFYDQKQATWGFDPKDKGSWQVIYSECPTSDCHTRSAPEDLDEESIYRSKTVSFSPVRVYPYWQDDRVFDLELDECQIDHYIELCDSVFNGCTKHQLLGLASPIQGINMDLECQLVSNGIYCGDPSGYKDPRAAILAKSKDQWQLLLQIDSDDEAEMMWGDMGMLYFWITKDDLKAKNFDNCWMILQCG